MCTLPVPVLQPKLPRPTSRIALLLALALAISEPAFAAAADPWEGKLGRVERALSAGDWAKAEKAARKLVGELCDAVSRGRAPEAPLATAAAYLTIAEAGLGLAEEARWHWRTARQLFSELARFDLAAYPAAFAVLSPPWAPPAGGPEPFDFDRGSGPGIVAPRRLDDESPVVQLAQGLPGGKVDVSVRALVGTDGLLSQPKLLSVGDPAVMFVALDAIRQWRFAPATVDGTPVPALYTLVVGFEIKEPLQQLDLGSGDERPR